MSNVLRVVLMGKTGVGKSSTGNTLLGREVFLEVRGLTSGTDRCQWADHEVEGVTLQITDTPGLSDTHRPEAEILREVGKSIAVASPGPHVILTVVRCDARYTKEEAMAYLTLRNMFGPDVKKYMIVVFVGADSYGNTLEKQTMAVKEAIDKTTGPLKDLLDDAGGRFYALNNKASPEDKKRQVAELIGMMKTLQRDRGGKYFQNSVSDMVSDLVEPLVEGRAAKDHTSRAQAIRDTNRAIVEETESPDFFNHLDETIKPVVWVAAEATAKGLQVVSGGLHGMAKGLQVTAEALDDNPILKWSAEKVQGAAETVQEGAKACQAIADKIIPNCSLM